MDALAVSRAPINAKRNFRKPSVGWYAQSCSFYRTFFNYSFSFLSLLDSSHIFYLAWENKHYENKKVSSLCIKCSASFNKARKKFMKIW